MVTADVQERLIVHQFAFPGWAAWIDGAPVAVEEAGRFGMLAVEVPAGRHAVELAWTWTPFRLGAAVVSVAGLLLLVPLGGATWRRLDPRRWPRAGIRVAVVCVLAAGVVGALLAPPWSRVTRLDAQTPGAVTGQNVGDGLTLVDVRHDTARMAADRVVQSRLVWLVRRAPTTGYRAFVELVAPDGVVHHRAPWVYEPLSRVWERGELVPTTVATRVPRRGARRWVSN